MILQIDKRLERRWHKTGCYLASIAFLANKKANTPLSTEILNEMLIDW